MHLYPSGSIINNRYEVVQGPLEKPSLKGGMGMVYLCADRAENGRPVALKTFQPQFLPNRAARDRFLREGDTWLKLGYHPHIVRCYEVFGMAIGPEVFFVLELVAEAEGKLDASLRCWLRPEGVQRPGIALPPEQALRFALHIVRGMRQATTKIPGLVHRDLKPENVLVGRDGNARITDFGLASAFQAIGQVKEEQVGEEIPATGRMRTQLTGGLVGTPLYMAPEQWRGETLDVRTDIYALGCILYEMLSGEFAISAGSLESLKKSHLQGWVPHKLAKMSQGVIGLLVRCSSVRTEERYGSWQELESALATVYQSVSGRVLPELPGSKEETAAERLAEGWSLNAIGLSYFNIGKFHEALEYFQRVRIIGKTVDDRELESIAVNNLGITCRNLGDINGAIELFRRNLSDAQERGDRYTEGLALYNLGIAYSNLGELHQAIKYTEQYIIIAREIGDKYGEGSAMVN